VTRRALAVLLAGAALGAWGCDPEAPEDPSLAEDVAPLLTASCAFSSCHGGTTPPGFVRLGPAPRVSPSEVRANLVDQPAHAHPDLRLVVPGDPDASFLMRKLEGRFEDLPCAPEDCGERMPQRNTPLRDWQIQTLRNWIARGAKDN
jgi:hypothetical protein